MLQDSLEKIDEQNMSHLENTKASLGILHIIIVFIWRISSVQSASHSLSQ